MDRLSLYMSGMLPSPQNAGNGPVSELFCSMRYAKLDMLLQLSDSVPAECLGNQTLGCSISTHRACLMRGHTEATCRWRPREPR